MGEKRYNVWLHIETVYLDENGEETGHGDEDYDMSKLLDMVSLSRAIDVVNGLCIEHDSPYRINPVEEEEKE